MLADKIISASGETRARHYKLERLVSLQLTLPIDASVREDVIWRREVAPKLQSLAPNVLLICQHGFTEMLNNVIDHSGSGLASIFVSMTAAKVEMCISDLGIGIFNKIQQEKSLDDPQEAIFELSKGKLTTDPENHSGEGIFFTSRMFDKFAIMSDHFSLVCSPQIGDWWLDLADCNMEVKEIPSKVQGTSILMEIGCFSDRTMGEVMNKFAGESNDYCSREPMFR